MKMSEKIVEICKIKKKNFSIYKMAEITLEAYKKLCVNTELYFTKNKKQNNFVSKNAWFTSHIGP